MSPGTHLPSGYTRPTRGTRAANRPGSSKTPATVLGHRLRELRQAAGLTQAQLGARIGYTTQAGNRVSDHELGHHMPTLMVLARYAEAFGITVSRLLEGVL